MSGHQIKIITQEGESISFECFEDEDVITAAVRQDIYLMSSCREGGCATCKGSCTKGDYVLGKCSSQALPYAEEEAGEVLLCRCFPNSDLEVEVPYTYDRISFSPEGLVFEAEIIDLAMLSTNVMKLQLRRTGEDKVVKFDPGQYFDLEIPGTSITRSYSPANTENKSGYLEFLIRIVEKGKFSEYLKDEAKLGQKINVKGPSGFFGLKENGFTPRCFVAGGTGLAPILSMVRHMHEWGEPQKCVIYFGVNTENEVFYLNELLQLAAQMPTLEIKICVWKFTDTWRYEKGSVVDILSRDLRMTGIKPDLYLCGPPGMVNATFEVCAEIGVPNERIYLEKFLSSESP